MTTPTSKGVAPKSAVTREVLHTRKIDFTAYQRSDGLFEIEGRVVDRKTVDFHHREGRSVPAGDAIHDMGVRLVYDLDLVVREIETFTDYAPFSHCPEGGRALQTLVGLRMSKGWNSEVRSRLSGARSCTHLMEILTPMATAVFQSLGFLLIKGPDRVDENGKPRQIDGCYAYAADGPLVLKRWPQFHRPATAPTHGSGSAPE